MIEDESEEDDIDDIEEDVDESEEDVDESEEDAFMVVEEEENEEVFNKNMVSASSLLSLLLLVDATVIASGFRRDTRSCDAKLMSMSSSPSSLAASCERQQLNNATRSRTPITNRFIVYSLGNSTHCQRQR